MSPIKKITLINIIVLFSYSFLSRIYDIDLAMLIILLLLSIQVMANFVWGLVLIFSKDTEQKEKSKVFLLNSLLILLIGVPTCFGAGLL